MEKRQFIFIGLLLGLTLMLSACGSSAPTGETPPAPLSVQGQTVAQSLSVKQTLTYPGLVAAASEATIVAKASGNLMAANLKIGDQVALGQEIGKINDVNATGNSAGSFNVNQIKQAQNSLDQAQAAYALSKSSYDNLLVSSVKDLRSAEIARDQAVSGESNLAVTAENSLKSAGLAYDTAKISTEQARLTLANQQSQVAQNIKSATDNADLAANSAASTAGALITGINNIAALDTKGSISLPYSGNLGVLDSSSLTGAQDSYQRAKDAYQRYSAQKFSNLTDKINAAIALSNVVKEMADDAKILFDKTITSSSLPQTSLSGPSLSGLQSTVAGYQAQIGAALSQVTSAGQTLENASLGGQSLLDGLTQAYSMARQQEASAQQNLNSLAAGNASQKDQAGYVASLAQNQYDNLKVKIEVQVAGARTQMENSALQYNSALLALQNLYDAHSVISPLSGTITKVFVADSQTVAPGQAIATVSQTKDIKVQFYVAPESLADIKPGLPVTVTDDSGNNYSGIVAAVSPQADPISRRFLVEVKLEDSSQLLLGTVVNVAVTLIKSAGAPGLMILPLAAVTVGQNGNYIFIADSGLAKMVPVEIKEVVGELARVRVDLPLSAVVIIDGNKLLQDGEAVTVRQ